MADVKPFVDFYRQHAISPVSQDISDLERHLERRASLYRLLGIAPVAVSGNEVIEFGPGSGHNAIATAAFHPAHYAFVDANPTGIARLRALFERYAPELSYHVDESLIEEYRSDARYDLVICEGVIPFQMDPKGFARHVAGFAKPGGLVSLTTIDAASFLGDLGRRIIGDKLVPPQLPAPERVAALVPLFGPHVATLSAMSRPLEDYLYDNIVQPLPGRMFSIADALDALGGEFEFFGSSPAFVTDLRWFKRLYGDARETNARAAEAYHRNVINLLDTRIEVAPHDPELGSRILALAGDAYAGMQSFETGGATTMAEIAQRFSAIARLVEAASPTTAESIDQLAAAIADEHLTTMPGGAVASFFGRGMQYVSFVRAFRSSRA